jgi:hypothetical protein
MNTKLYFISKTGCILEDSYFYLKQCKLFTNLNDALENLNSQCKNGTRCKDCDFCIRTLTKIDNKYIQTHETYYHQKVYS